MKTTSLINALFNQNYYLLNNPDVNQAVALPQEGNIAATTALTPLAHFLQFGAEEGRSPSLLFSERYYLQQNPDVASTHMNAFQHFIEYGYNEGRSPSYLFDSEYYLAKNQDVAKSGLNAFEHFLQYGESEQRSPSYLFDKAYYLAQNQDVANAHINPVEHFLTYGLEEGRIPTQFFDSAYYLAHNSDVANSNMSAFQHYMEYGQFENRAPSANFNATSYLTQNPDVAQAIQNGTLDSAIEHYILFGKAEGRSVVVVNAPSDNTNNNNDNNNNGGNNDNGGGGSTTNSSPVNTISGLYDVDEGYSLALGGIAVSDTDSPTITLTFTSENGIIYVQDSVVGGLAEDNITGNDTGELIISGTVAAINATLASTGGLYFIPNLGFFGTASISMVSSDGQNTDTDSITVTVYEDTTVYLDLTVDSDNLVAEDGAVTFYTDQSFFDETDTLTGSDSEDTLFFTDACDITPENLANKTGIDIIKLGDNENHIVLSDEFVESSDNGTVVINNRNFTVTYLDTSNVFSPNTVIIGGTGVVTLADDVDNSVTSQDDVNTSILDGTGNDTILGGSGDDTIMLMAGDNNIGGGIGDDMIIGDIDSLSTDNTIDGGEGRDTLISTDLLDIDPDMQISGIEVIALSSDDSYIALSDDFVQSAENATVELDNGTFIISYLDTSDVQEDGKVIVTGSGLVILADDVANRVYAGDDNGASIIGGTGDDTIIGGTQDDTITGWDGQDVLTGGEGADHFIYTSLFETFPDTPDIITDFDTSDDVIDVSGLGFTDITSDEEAEGNVLFFSNDGDNTLITDSSGDFMLILSGVYTDLSNDNMMF